MASGVRLGRLPRFASARVAEVLAATGGNVSKTAAQLGTSRSVIHRYVSDYSHVAAALERARRKAAAAQAAPAVSHMGRELDVSERSEVEAPLPAAAGRWIPAPPWAPTSWLRVEVLVSSVSFKHYDALRVHDVIAVPAFTARGWIAAGVARPVDQGESAPAGPADGPR